MNCILEQNATNHKDNIFYLIAQSKCKLSTMEEMPCCHVELKKLSCPNCPMSLSFKFHVQCSKLRVHPAPVVHISEAGCTDFGTFAQGIHVHAFFKCLTCLHRSVLLR